MSQDHPSRLIRWVPHVQWLITRLMEQHSQVNLDSHKAVRTVRSLESTTRELNMRESPPEN
jgi:hypothetical protein